MKAIRIKILFSLLFIGSYTLPYVEAQSPAIPSVSWAVTGETAKGASISKFVIRNPAKQAVLTEGWDLWFNSMRSIDVNSVTAPFRLTHENGDLYRLSVPAGFKGIAPADSAVISFAFRSNVANFSFAPSGLYIATNQSDVIHAINDYAVLPYRGGLPTELKHLAAQYELNQRLDQITNPDLRIIPRPVELTKSAGNFTISSNTTLWADQRFSEEAKKLNALLKTFTGKNLLANKDKDASGIRIEYQSNMAKEAYLFESTADAITIKASAPAGAFYGIQTLKSLLPVEVWGKPATTLSIPLVRIQDEPRFAYRGFMMDIARNFHSKEQILKVLDLMASYKLNTFHLHFSDDEGWRVEIPALPELTEVGSRRSGDFNSGLSIQPAYGSGAEAIDKQYLNEAEFIEILRYAADRHIRVIPEIETPGHGRAAIKAMDARYAALMKQGKEKEAKEFLLRDFGDRSVYSSAQYWNDNVMNVALPSTYHFIETVVDAFVDMYDKAGLTLTTISLGGDEVPRGSWEKSPLINQMMNQLSLKSVHEVWPYYIQRLTEMMDKKNLQLAGWEEMGMANDGKGMKPNPKLADKGILLDVWNNVAGAGSEDLAYKLANLGYKVVFTPANNFYLDQAWNNSYQEPGHNWATYTDLERSFSFIPLNFYRNIKSSGRSLENLTEKGRQNIVGIKGALWAEKISDSERSEYMMLPRLMALAERAWAPEASWEKFSVKNWEQPFQKDWLGFAYQVNRKEFVKLDYMHSGYDYRIPDIGVKIADNSISTNTTAPAFKVYYTTDGTEPDLKSKLYTAPIPLNGTVKLKAFNPTGRGGRTLIIDKDR